MELRENRTELERLLGDVWDYQDGGHEKTHLPKWLFALTLAAAVTCTSSPSDIVVPVMTALAPAPDKLSIDNVSSQNVAEDLDYRIARHTDSMAGWRAFLAAHPDGPHARGRAGRDRPAAAGAFATAGPIPGADADGGRHGAGERRRRRSSIAEEPPFAGHGRGGASAAGPAG